MLGQRGNARLWRFAAATMAMLLAATAHAAPAAPGVQTYRAQYRLAAELAEVLQPLLQAGEAALGQGAMLIVQADPQRAGQLIDVARNLDQPQRRLRIRVRQAQARTASAAQGGVHIEPERVEIYGDAGTLRRESSADQFVVAQEGRSAHLTAGVRVPLRTVTHDAYGHSTEAVEYQELTTGFDVVPRVVGNQVTLEINPYADDGMHFSATRATVTGTLGEWLPLAGSVTRSADRRQGLSGASRATWHIETTLELLVESW